MKSRPPPFSDRPAPPRRSPGLSEPPASPRRSPGLSEPFPPSGRPPRKQWGPKRSSKPGLAVNGPMKVILFHKDKDLVCTHHDELGRETVYDRLRSLLPPELKRLEWHAIGRLDADTTGLLLFTNDGALVHYATQPHSKLPKRYRALVKGLLTEEQLTALREGVELSGGLGRSGPAEVTLLQHQVATSWIDLVITEGKNRQVRRMLLAIGSQIIRLERIGVGGLSLDVPLNEWRLVHADEVARELGYRA